MELGRVVIITSAARQEAQDYIAGLLGPGCRLICADGGAEVALALGLTPDLVVGDFDSLAPAALERLEGTCPVRGFPTRKDKTDAHLALEFALAMRPEEIVVAGAFGDRLDHELGLVLLLAGLGGLPSVRLVGARQEAFILKGRTGGEEAADDRGAAARPPGPDRAVLAGRPGDAVSLLPLSPQVDGVTTDGLSYPLSDAVLRWGETLGVSNEMLGSEAAVRVGSGTLLVVHLRGAW